MGAVLTYRADLEIDELGLDECRVVPSKLTPLAWVLCFHVATTDDHEQTFRVPVNPGGDHVERGPLGRTWGLSRVDASTWRVSPSIDFGTWHQTLTIVGVPEDVEWSQERTPA